jgi:sugar/nucleoside kinase (ribokinase family)
MGERVVVLADLVVDYTFKIDRLPVEAGQQHDIDDMRIGPGGAAKTLIAGAHLGLSMQAVGTTGDDATGTQLLASLRAEGVDVGEVVPRTGRPTTVVVILTAPGGAHAFLGRHGPRTPVGLLRGWQDAIVRAAALYLDGWTYRAIGPEPTLQVVRLADDRGIPVFFDPGPQAVHLDPAWLEGMLRHTRVLLLAEEEANAIARGDPAPEAMARSLLAHGPRWVVIKRGIRGCYIASEVDSAAHPGFRVPVVDTTGAGDVVAAAVILAVLRGYTLSATAEFANAAGAAAVQKLGGGLDLPGIAEIDAVLKQAERNR